PRRSSDLALPCGLKRGFTFYHHRFDQRFVHDPVAHSGELLVAASPHNAVADTHWYRPAFDHFLVSHAQSLGATYLDEATVTLLEENDHGVLLSVYRLPARLRARLLIDANRSEER